ncbi:MAG: hypothetical protein CMN01_02475 [Rickettsiales bacterium]|nr:hypothetical protein [Rickettsiales bacterium]|tara:strand:+ start:230 stop:442 length:213 start_codon:yes stop_codon:yes gene_type:complete
MNEEKLNLSIRKFLKSVGINSQRIIEDKIRNLVREGKIPESKSIEVSASIKLDELNINEKISGVIEVDLE